MGSSGLGGLHALEAEYRAATPASAHAWERACRSLPGGDTRAAAFFPPYPIAVARGKGSKLRDLDGRELIDFLNNYSALILGHGHPAIVEAVQEVLPHGTGFSAAHESQTELAERLVERVASIDLVRFCNSGTEATMWAVRAARAFTRRPLIVKAYGGYHGSYDQLEQWAWESGGPRLAVGGIGDLDRHTLVVPYDDAEALEAAIAGREQEIAAVILEPLLGSAGIFSASPEYLRAARRFCDRAGALMILDEVISLRLGRGGVQGAIGVEPDLTALGKIIGGGFPVGAFGGRREVMSIFDPSETGFLGHTGTYNGNPVTMTAGARTLDLLDEVAYTELDRLGASLAAGFEAAIAAHGLELSLTRAGSLIQLHPTREPLPLRPGETRDTTVIRALHLGLCLEGVHAAPRGFLNCSLVHTDEDVAFAVAAFGRALARAEQALPTF